MADIAGEAIEMLGDMFGATAMTPERIEIAKAAREHRIEEQHSAAAEAREEKRYHDRQDRQQADAAKAKEIEERQSRYWERQHEAELER